MLNNQDYYFDAVDENGNKNLAVDGSKKGVAFLLKPPCDMNIELDEIKYVIEINDDHITQWHDLTKNKFYQIELKKPIIFSTYWQNVKYFDIPVFDMSYIELPRMRSLEPMASDKGITTYISYLDLTSRRRIFNKDNYQLIHVNCDLSKIVRFNVRASGIVLV